jgi:hypothetical protein
VSALLAYGGSGAQVEVTISGSEHQRWRFPLDADDVISVAGPLGATVVTVRAGSARIAASPCENKTCIAAGSLSRDGQFSACIPNRVIVTIEGRPAVGELDAVAW